MKHSGYDKLPCTHIDGTITRGWDDIISLLSQRWADEPVWAIELYNGTYEEEFLEAFSRTGRKVVSTRSLMRSEEEIRRLTDPFMGGDDPLFGYMNGPSPQRPSLTPPLGGELPPPRGGGLGERVPHHLTSSTLPSAERWTNCTKRLKKLRCWSARSNRKRLW